MDFTQWGTTRRLQETASAPRCEFSEAGSGDIGVVVFIGNLVLVAVILLALFFFHVALVSGAEAYWLTKVSPPSTYVIPRVRFHHGVCLHLDHTSVSTHRDRVHFVEVRLTNERSILIDT